MHTIAVLVLGLPVLVSIFSRVGGGIAEEGKEKGKGGEGDGVESRAEI